MSTSPTQSISEKEKTQFEEHVESKSHQKTPEEKQAELAAAIAIDPGIPAGSARAFKFYLILLCVYCCGGDTGFDSTVMGGINAMKQYLSFFGLDALDEKTSIIFGIYTIGSLVAVIPSFILPDLIGRRWTMFIGNGILMMGAIVTATAQNRSIFILGRFFTGLGVACAGTAAKSYISEMSPPQSRGRYMGFLNSFYYIGQMVASGMMVGTGKMSGDLAWRLPLWVQAVPAAINFVFIMFLPESPRWLFANGREDDARKVLASLHSATNDINSPVVKLEIEEFREKIALDGAHTRWWDFRSLFGTRSQRYRMYMVIMIGFFGQLSGNGMITYFLPALLELAGITDQQRKLELNFVNSITSFIGAITGSLMVDRFGRRTLLLGATTGCVILLAIITGLLSNPTSGKGRGDAGVAFIYLFMVCFSWGWTPMQALYPAEVLSYDMRAKGLAFLTVVTNAAGCVNTFGLPVALKHIGWKVYLIFLCWDTLEVVVIYFFAPETRGLTLEEIEEVFQQPSPRKYSTDKHFKFEAAPVDAENRAA